MRSLMIVHDLSHEADAALLRAVQLSRQHDAELHVLHVIQGHLPPAVMASAKEAAQRALDESLRRTGAPSDTQLTIIQGRVAETILDNSHEGEVDLIVMGLHHQKSPEMFVGTTLERVVRQSALPVLVVKNADGQPYGRASIALDFSLCATHALGNLFDLLPNNADIYALHVFDLPASGFLGRPRSTEKMIETQKQMIAQLVQDEQERLGADGPTIHHDVRQGGIANALDESIYTRHSQLLALGSHGRGVISEALLGSLTQHYLRNPPCDLLICK